MAVPLLTPAMASGEIAPSLYGRVDIDRERVAATTERNMFVRVQGGAFSRAGTKFCLFSKQTGRQFPPRLFPFQFSIDEGIAIEAGHQYFRFFQNGEPVVLNPVSIAGATQANPAVISFGAQGAVSATINNALVTAPYAPGDLVTLAGGTTNSPAILAVTNSRLLSILAKARGTGYVVADTITLAGGTFSAAAVVTVATVVSVQATGNIVFAANPAAGDTITLNGQVWTFVSTLTAANQTLIQSNLAATLGQLVTDLNASANVLITPATYSADTTTLYVVFDTPGAGGNAYTLAASVATVSGATLTGGTASGLGTVTVTTPGVYTALPALYEMTQSATSGGGTGASFQTAIFGPNAVSVNTPGAYSAVPANPVSQASTTGIGVGVRFTVTWGAVAPFSNGDWVFVENVGGMTELNGNTYVLAGVTATTAQLIDVYGNAINSTAYGAFTAGGTASEIYTVTTPYNEQDLPYLKFTQSADVMTLCCVNPETGTEYEPKDLQRLSNTNWTFSNVVSSGQSRPTGVVADVNYGDTVYYAYQVTAINPIDGTESRASNIARGYGTSYDLDVDVQIKITWTPVEDVQQYNIYKAQISYYEPVPGGTLFGYIGSSYGPQFVDRDGSPDYAQTPPRHKNPFARGQALNAVIVTQGSGYTSTPTATIGTVGGSGAVTEVVVVDGEVGAILFYGNGSGYAAGDTITITGGGGAGATATLEVGPVTGTYPAVPGYFQQRRVFSNTLNLPDTYWMSQPGAYKNFDSRLPTIATDAIVGSPWAVQVNGIQFMVQTSGGLLMMTGQAAWILVGAGSFATNVQPISPDSQDANPQPFTGCSPIIPPIKINFDILYVTAKGSLYYDLPYQLYALSEPLDLTAFSSHLFTGHDVVSHAWCEQPFKLLWSIRDDGIMLSLTFLKSEQVVGWARHDTNGEFVSNCSIVEPPVDAHYLATKRYPGTHTAYMIEQMNDRIWNNVEDVWAVDCGLELEQPAPNATLSASSAEGLQSISSIAVSAGGASYSAGTQVLIFDQGGTGSGATATATVVGGIVTAITVNTPGAGYSKPVVSLYDPADTGNGEARAVATLSQSVTFTASSPIFALADIGDVIRMGGGVATITGFTNTSTVTAALREPITDIRPNSGGQVRPQVTGTWTQTAPISTISGLLHLAGATVTGLADGVVVTPRVVSALGVVTLDAPATSVVLGLGFQAQLQSVYPEGGNYTLQGQRKKVARVDALLEASRDVKIGSNQIDGSILSPPEIAPEWVGMNLADRPQDFPPKAYAASAEPLYTGWVSIPVQGGITKNGQAALQQDYPLPMNVISLVSRVLPGDSPDAMISAKGGPEQ
jgi:hypothetical protein